jgi:DNA repair photolyase
MATHPLQPIAFKGRGTGWRMAHRFDSTERDWVDDGWGDAADPAGAETLPPRTEVMEERVRSLLSPNDSPDIPFEWSINPYRGCEHGCIYCYARPTHSYLNLSPGLDFETRLVAKVNAAEVLVRELARPSHRVSPINIGSATDAYQPIERQLGLTRSVLEVLHRCRHPYTIVTKSSGVERDLDLIAADAAERRVMVFVSVTTMDGDLCRKLEPRAAAPHRRLQTVRTLARAGVPVGVNVAPIIPFLNEPEIERLIDAAAEAGAASIHYTVLRLPWEVNPLFQQWLDQHVPDRAARIMARVRDLRGGADYKAEFGQRMKGEGLWAQLIAQRVDKACARAGVLRRAPPLDTTAFRPPGDERQAELF